MFEASTGPLVGGPVLFVYMPIVHTFYMPVPGMPQPGRLLALWAKSWQDGGFVTRILTEADARAHPGYEYFNDRVKRFPTSNPPEYERACFIRHLAMANIEGGLLVDADCILRSKDDPEGPLPSHPVFLEPTRVPCAVMGTGEAFEAICDVLCEYDPGTEGHVSDMTILRKTNWQAESSCIEHGCSGRPIENDPGDGWKTAPIIHFSNYSFQKLGWKGDKADLIQRVLHTLP